MVTWHYHSKVNIYLLVLGSAQKYTCLPHPKWFAFSITKTKTTTHPTVPSLAHCIYFLTYTEMLKCIEQYLGFQEYNSSSHNWIMSWDLWWQKQRRKFLLSTSTSSPKKHYLCTIHNTIIHQTITKWARIFSPSTSTIIYLFIYFYYYLLSLQQKTIWWLSRLKGNQAL